MFTLCSQIVAKMSIQKKFQLGKQTNVVCAFEILAKPKDPSVAQGETPAGASQCTKYMTSWNFLLKRNISPISEQ